MYFMNHPMLMAFLSVIFYLFILGLITFFVVKAVRKSFRLREEQNELLRQLVANTRKEK